MIKDRALKLIFIPLLGIGLPLVSGIISPGNYELTELLLANLFFILTSFLIWSGCNFIHKKLRPLYAPIQGTISRIIVVCIVSAIYGSATSILSAWLWYILSPEEYSLASTRLFLLGSVLSVIIFTLIYEILFLTKERELDTRIVDQLDQERTSAELLALNNEMDPHFIFNSLTTLNYLIRNDSELAYLFNNRLAQVYKYFLINKKKDLISLREELDFISDYFYLLQIRHDNKLILHKTFDYEDTDVLIPPCSLQILIENAIKHNEFSESKPLEIIISINQNYLEVSNNVKSKPYAVPSTGVGLKNLSSRYRILFRKNIMIEKNMERYRVRLPLIG